MKKFARPIPLAGVAAGIAIAVVTGVLVARPWEGGTIHAEPSLTDPQVTLVFSEKGARDAAEAASEAVGFPVRPVDASSIGLAVKAVRIDPMRTDVPPGSLTNPRRAIVIYRGPEADPRDLGKPYDGLQMMISFLSGRWDTGPAVDDDGDPIEEISEIPFDVPGFTLLRITSLEAPGLGITYHLVSDNATFGVRVGYDGDPTGKQRPSDEEMLPILRALASAE
jgi:hypothetical protein